MTEKPPSRASAAQTIESSPPDKRTTADFTARPLRRQRRQKKGRGPLRGQRPRYRANTPDWEESVPNPAHNPFTMQWLNGALMARRGLVRGAIADAPRLRDIMERQVARDALRVDRQRARSDHAKLCPAKTAAGAAIIDDGRAWPVADHVPL